MKNNLLLLSFVVIAFTSTLKAESVVYNDNFDSYTTGVGVGTLGYIMWECGAAISEAVPANSGTKFANITGTAAKSCYMRKTVAVIAGHNYRFDVYTLGVAAKAHKIGYKSTVGSLVNFTSPNPAFTNNTWVKQTSSFTAVASENVDFFIYVYGTGNIYVDDFVVTDNSVTTRIENAPTSTVEIYKTAANQISINGCEVFSCKLFDVSGKLIQSATQNQFSIESNFKGILFAKITDKSGAIYNHKFVL